MFNTISHSSTIQIETAINCYYYILNVTGAKIKNTVNTCVSKDAEQWDQSIADGEIKQNSHSGEPTDSFLQS